MVTGPEFYTQFHHFPTPRASAYLESSYTVILKWNTAVPLLLTIKKLHVSNRTSFT